MTWAGRICEFSGVIVIIRGVIEERKGFTRELGLVEKTRRRLAGVRWPFRRSRSVTVRAGTADMVVDFGRAEAVGEVVPRWPDLPEDQLMWLKEQLVRERGVTERRLGKLSEQVSALQSKIDDLATSLTRSDEAMAKKFEAYVTGSVRPQVLGTALVLFGIVLTSWAEFL